MKMGEGGFCRWDRVMGSGLAHFRRKLKNQRGNRRGVVVVVVVVVVLLVW